MFPLTCVAGLADAAIVLGQVDACAAIVTLVVAVADCLVTVLACPALHALALVVTDKILAGNGVDTWASLALVRVCERARSVSRVESLLSNGPNLIVCGD